MVVLVAAAAAGILIASSGTKTGAVSHSNVPQGVRSSAAAPSLVASYRETAQLPPLLRSGPGRSEPARSELTSATLTLDCAQACSHGQYTGFGGEHALTAQGSRLTGASRSSCENDTLVLETGSELTARGGLPQAINGTLTRISTCPGMDVASPVSLHLTRS